ncbi:ABC transporter permease [Streptococcus suis]|nr:ABC transporter permease [Streptococcus suis]
MKALLKVEWLTTWRKWPVFIMAIGMPVGFYLFYSGMTMSPNPELQKQFVRHYLLTMTAFSMSSFGFFTFPYMLMEDRNNHWVQYLRHSKLGMGHYYLSKIIRVLIYFICSIVITFLVGILYRGVEMSVSGWIGSVGLLLLSSLVFLAFGLLIAQITSEQVMAIVGNLLFLSLAVIGGSWMPVETFPKWLQAISKWTPTYHVNQLVIDWSDKGSFNTNSFLIILLDVLLLVGLTGLIKKCIEVR